MLHSNTGGIMPLYFSCWRFQGTVTQYSGDALGLSARGSLVLHCSLEKEVWSLFSAGGPCLMHYDLV